MKMPAVYGFVFGLSLSSCQTVKGPPGVAHPKPKLAVAPTAQSKPLVSVKKEEPKDNSLQNLFPKKKPESAGESHETKEDRKPRFFGQIWIRPGLWDGDGQTLELAEDDGRDDDPNALSHLALKRKYRGKFPRESSGEQRIYKIVWKPSYPDPRKP